jgi:hypothetical protein
MKNFVSLQFLNPKIFGRTPWKEDQPDARPLLIQDDTNIEQTQTSIHALSGIRTHNSSFRVGEDSSCLSLHGHCDLRGVTTKLEIRIYEIKRAYKGEKYF